MKREDEYHSYKVITEEKQHHKLTTHEFLDNSYKFCPLNSKNVKYIIKIIITSALSQWPLIYNKNLNPNEFLSMFIYTKG